jgi:hypothetical protein
MFKGVLERYGGLEICTLRDFAFDIFKVISPCNVRLGDDSIAKAIGIASIVVGVPMRGKIYRIHITDMLHVPKLQTNLLLVNKLSMNGLKVQFIVNKCLS